MARIPDGTFKDWKDNDVISASDYKMERDVLKAAINDLDTLLKTADPNSFGSRLIKIEKEYLPKVERKFVNIFNYSNDWQARTNNEFGVYLDANGMVHVRGVMSWGTVGVGHVMIWGLPENVRPKRDMVLAVTCYNTRTYLDVLGTVTFRPNGDVAVSYIPDNTSVKFDGLTYPAF